MLFLRARRNDVTGLFWADLQATAEDLDTRDEVPEVLRELAAGDVSVVCDRHEADAALAWAQLQPFWPSHASAPVYLYDSDAD
jgi:hypothetical protein